MAQVTELVDELQLELAADRILCLYQFSWFQDIGSRPEDRDKIISVARMAYDELVRRHPDLGLAWVTWPNVSSDAAIPAGDDTPLDFLLDWEEESDAPLLALVFPR